MVLSIFPAGTNGEGGPPQAGRRGSSALLPKNQAAFAQILCTNPTAPRNLRNASARAGLAFLPEWPFSGFRTPRSCPSDEWYPRGTILG